MYPITQSDLQSGFALHLLNRLFSKMGYDIIFTQFTVRKLAHFTEYFIFAALLTVTIRILRKTLKGTLFFELFIFLTFPVVDETIQMSYPGRASSVRDVLIDFAGCEVGMGLFRLIFSTSPKGAKDCFAGSTTMEKERFKQRAFTIVTLFFVLFIFTRCCLGNSPARRANM